MVEVLAAWDEFHKGPTQLLAKFVKPPRTAATNTVSELSDQLNASKLLHAIPAALLSKAANNSLLDTTTKINHLADPSLAFIPPKQSSVQQNPPTLETVSEEEKPPITDGVLARTIITAALKGTRIVTEADLIAALKCQGLIAATFGEKEDSEFFELCLRHISKDQQRQPNFALYFFKHVDISSIPNTGASLWKGHTKTYLERAVSSLLRDSYRASWFAGREDAPEQLDLIARRLNREGLVKQFVTALDVSNSHCISLLSSNSAMHLLERGGVKDDLQRRIIDGLRHSDDSGEYHYCMHYLIDGNIEALFPDSKPFDRVPLAINVISRILWTSKLDRLRQLFSNKTINQALRVMLKNAEDRFPREEFGEPLDELVAATDDADHIKTATKSTNEAEELAIKLLSRKDLMEFLDPDLLVTLINLQYNFNQSSSNVLYHIAKSTYDARNDIEVSILTELAETRGVNLVAYNPELKPLLEIFAGVPDAALEEFFAWFDTTAKVITTDRKDQIYASQLKEANTLLRSIAAIHKLRADLELRRSELGQH